MPQVRSHVSVLVVYTMCAATAAAAACFVVGGAGGSGVGVGVGTLFVLILGARLFRVSVNCSTRFGRDPSRRKFPIIP